MLMSMTGFARAQKASEHYDTVIELRSVNHRFLDVKVRGNIGISPLEQRVRTKMATVLSRGRVEVSIHLDPKGQSIHEIAIDRPLMNEFVRTATDLAEDAGVGASLSLSDLVGFTPAFQVKERDLADSATLWESIESALEDALTALAEMRRAEGTEMAADLAARMQTLGEHLDAIESLSDQRRATRQSELEEKVVELLKGAAEPSSVVMEVARLVERGDIAEELTRFRSHLELWKTAVGGTEPCGKKLDFIVQEMNREVNTIGSKSQDADIAERVIGMKTEMERVREQVQNIE